MLPSDPWWPHPLTVVDFEATSVDPDTCMPVSVAAVRFESGVEVAHFTSLLNPGRPIPAESTAIHRITDEMVAGEPTFAEIEGCVFYLMRGALPVAYNAEYDRKVLARVCTQARPDWLLEAANWIDPLVMVRGIDRFVSGQGRHRLETTCKRWAVDLDDAHNALADARACGRLLWRMQDTLGDISAEKLLRAIQVRRAEQERDFAAYRARMDSQKGAAQ